MENPQDQARIDAVTDEMESSLDDMEKRSDKLDDQVEAARREWRAKREDSGVPGAPPPEESDEESSAESASDDAGDDKPE